MRATCERTGQEDWEGPVKAKVRAEGRGKASVGRGEKRSGLLGRTKTGQVKRRWRQQLRSQRSRGQVRAGLGLTLPTHLQLPQVPGPGEGAGATAPGLQQEPLFLESKGRGQPTAAGLR